MFELEWTDKAKEIYTSLKADASKAKQWKAIRKTLKLLARNPRYPSLRAHEFASLRGPNSEKVFEAYAEQQTPAAYRVFGYYGPDKGRITIFAITSHRSTKHFPTTVNSNG